MSCTDCASNEIKYAGNGVQVLFTFPFTYLDKDDVYVELFNYDTRRWVSTTDWSFTNATTIEFNTAPDAPVDTEIEPQNIKIARCTDIDPLSATFYPGSAIRAQDLNNNFEQLQFAIQEGRCQVPSWLYDYLAGEYWNKFEDTTYSTDDWESEADDDHVPTTGAVDQYVDSKVFDILDEARVKRVEQITDGASSKIDDAHIFSTAASAQRHDMYTQDPKPGDLPYEQPGKEWFDTNTLDTYVWDPNAEVWVDMGNAGPVGPQGGYGPAGKVIVSDNAPTSYPDLGQNEPRELESGDLWYNSSIAQLYVWYVDRTGGQWVSVTKTGPQGPEGPPGSPGTGGGGIPEAPTDGQVYGRQNSAWVPTSSNLLFTAPLVNTNGTVKIDLQTINPII